MLLFWKTVICEMYSKRTKSREEESKKARTFFFFSVRLAKESTVMSCGKGKMAGPVLRRSLQGYSSRDKMFVFWFYKMMN